MFWIGLLVGILGGWLLGLATWWAIDRLLSIAGRGR